MRHLIGMMAIAVLAAPASAETKFPLSGENTKITFVGTKKDGKHEGGFKTLSGSATLGTNDPTGLKIEVEIDTKSLYSDEPKLTSHLKSPDFFDVASKPTAKFTSTKVEKGKDGFTVTGDLTLLGKTKSISFPAKIATSGEKLTLTSEFKIDRTEFGMTYGAGRVDKDVSIKVALEATK